MWFRTFFSSGLSKYVLTDKSARGDGHGNRTPVAQVWYRILSNLVAAILVALSLAALAVVVAQGTFHREDVQYHDQAKPSHWNSYGASCKLNHVGWVPHSCGASEVNTTASVAAWNAIGANVAARLAIPAGAVYFVSTCWMGATPEIGWASLQLLIGYDYYPACRPQNGSQPIAGFFMVETALRPTHPEGVYLVTGFSDKVTNTTKPYTGADGLIHHLVAGVETMQVALDGTTVPDPNGRNTEIPSFPLGRRYAISSRNQAVMVAIFNDLDTTLGWSTGRDSKIPVVSGWIVGHAVDNWGELLAMQVVFSILSMLLFWGDVYMTMEGLHGVLHNKPVLTYDVLSGLERRKLLMVFITLNSMPSILYVDVARIYYGTESGLKVWAIAIISLSILAAFSGFLLVTLLQYIPSPRFIHHHVATFSAPVFLYASIISVASTIGGEMFTLNLSFNNAPSGLSFFVRGAFWPSGAYTPEGAPAAMAHLLPMMWLPVLLSLLGAIAYSKLKRILEGHPGIVNTEWTTKNAFLRATTVPHWITSMPLASHHGIKIGNRTFCKPSTQVLFGYASVVPVEASKKVLVAGVGAAAEPDADLISIYDLGWTLVFGRWLPWRPKRFGTNAKNKFQAPSGDARLLKARRYKHTRGAAID